MYPKALLLNIVKNEYFRAKTERIEVDMKRIMRRKNFYNRNEIAFTMAEILISLTIIGIIAAITLPSLRDNINEKAWATQKKALYSRMSQALAMMTSLNGYGVDPANDANTTANAAHTFITDGLSKVLEINNICTNDKLSDCGIVSKYKNTGGVKNEFPTTMQTLNSLLAGRHRPSTVDIGYSLLATNAAAFETKNGESIAVFYQPNCRYGDSGDIPINGSNAVVHYAAPHMCANFIFDLNGKKGPNTAGKDIGFITVFYPSDSQVVMPIPLEKDSATGQTYANALTVCRNVSPDVRLPNREELAAIAFNNSLLNISQLSTNGNASTFYATTNKWKMAMSVLMWSTKNYDRALRVRCIKR